MLIKWDPAVTLTPRANYMFVRCSQTTIHTTHLIPTSTATPLAAPSAYWQERCRSQKGGGAIAPGGEDEEGEVK